MKKTSRNIAVKAVGTLALGLLLGSSQVFAAADDNADIINRIKPVGQVCVEGDDSCGSAAAAPAAATASANRSGEDIYNSHCTTCHATGVAGAPKLGSHEWKVRLDEKGIDTLLTHALGGFNAMPPKGTCNDCSDDEIKSAIEFMLSKAE